jgi:DNA-binding response OmpR family regulator
MNADRPPIFDPQKGPEAPRLEGPAAAVLVGQPVGALALLAGTRVLVVEDDDDSRELICAILKRAGAKVLCVESVAKAMDGVYHSFDPDVVLTDFSMPDADGLDLIREFRKAPSTRAVLVPIIVLSGHTGVRWRQLALEAGAADLLTKPFEPAVLITRIAAAVASGRSGPH